MAGSRNRFYVEDTREGGDGWTLVDTRTAQCVSFETRREANQAATFARAYVRHWGRIDLGSFPYTLDQKPSKEAE